MRARSWPDGPFRLRRCIRGASYWRMSLKSIRKPAVTLIWINVLFCLFQYDNLVRSISKKNKKTEALGKRDSFKPDTVMEAVHAMKSLKYLIGAASVMMVASFAASPALAAVSGTPHDLTSFTAANDGTEQICVYCHTPHNGAQGGGGVYDGIPLWNRQASVGTIAPAAFTLYTSPTMDNATGAPTGVSLGCLSCHDGVSALDSLIVTTQATAFLTPGTVMPAGAAVLGNDLRNDHPVSMTYAGGLPADWVATPALPLYGVGGDQVECGSCHNPHDNTNTKFQRISNDNSALCTSCHVK